MVIADLRVDGGSGAEVGSAEGHWVNGSGPGRKIIRLNRKPMHTSWVVQLFNLAHVRGRGCVIWGFQFFLMLIVRGGVTISKTRCMFLCNSGLGWDDFWDERRPTSPGQHA